MATNTNQQGVVHQTRSTRKPYFTGFSTVGRDAPPYSLTNIELVKRDISNQFATPMGARMMLPLYGTHIYDFLFDPFDEYTKAAIIEDAVRVVESDPRVSLVSIDAVQEDQTLSVFIELMFRPDDITDSMFVTFSLKDQETF